MQPLTADQLHELLDYDPVTGIFRRRVSLSNSCKVGEIAGSQHSSGYIMISVRGKLYYAHRLAWLYVHGKWPAQIDHRNGKRADNPIDNLRECTTSENQQNLKKEGRGGTTSFLGVHFDRFTNRWRASIRANGKTIKLGRFNTEDEASAAYWVAKKRLHPFQPIMRELNNA